MRLRVSVLGACVPLCMSFSVSPWLFVSVCRRQDSRCLQGPGDVWDEHVNTYVSNSTLLGEARSRLAREKNGYPESWMYDNPDNMLNLLMDLCPGIPLPPYASDPGQVKTLRSISGAPWLLLFGTKSSVAWMHQPGGCCRAVACGLILLRSLVLKLRQWHLSIFCERDL